MTFTSLFMKLQKVFFTTSYSMAKLFIRKYQDTHGYQLEKNLIKNIIKFEKIFNIL